MQRISAARRANQVFLWVVPLLPFPMLVYRSCGLKLYVVAWAVQVLLMGVAVWILAADSIKNSTADRRGLLVPGVFLIACWASTTLAANMGPRHALRFGTIRIDTPDKQRAEADFDLQTLR